MGNHREKPSLQEIDAWLDAALDHPTLERSAFLAQSCKDVRIREQVEQMLQNLEDTDPESPLFEGLRANVLEFLNSSHLVEDPVPQKLGAFLVDRVLGQGGMGVVYRARRDREDFDQWVALKVIRGAMDSPMTRRRFIREQRILTTLSHPNIARLFDGGYLDDGRPYLALELIDGVPIDQYCNRERLRPQQRVKLFLNAARAIAHAHRRLIVHRDIKPANILDGGTVDRHQPPPHEPRLRQPGAAPGRANHHRLGCLSARLAPLPSPHRAKPLSGNWEPIEAAQSHS